MPTRGLPPRNEPLAFLWRWWPSSPQSGLLVPPTWFRGWRGVPFTGRGYYVVWAVLCTLYAGLLFFGAMRQQIQLLYASLPPSQLTQHLRALGPWSAPLDDVFIHFDFARSTARGHPFEWIAGNGYSSGGTSLLYPFVLALGWLVGFRELNLVVWAALVAGVSVVGFCLAARRMFRELPTWTAFLLPPTLLCVGVMNWNLWSGMEVALFLGLWGYAFTQWDTLIRKLRGEGSLGVLNLSGQQLVRQALGLGLAGAALAATRPEGITSVGVLVAAASGYLLIRGHLRGAALVALVGLAPGLAVLILQATANWLGTGETSAAGAVSKLEIYDPFRPPAQIFEDWKFFIHYQIDRITEYHLSDDPHHGWVIWYLAVIPLFSERTRSAALLLWASLIPWTLLVALNGQVRWQNERYAMPALAWLLVLAALGLASLWGEGARSWAGRIRWFTGAALGLWIAQGFLTHERPRFMDQLWFFGRASRNILEQHVRTGLVLRTEFDPLPRRVAVGDAGAIPYISDLPALDLIGLGGYRGLPFARAKRLGLGAVLELVERIDPKDRPDILALYPSWWDELPTLFGTRLFEVPVRGNVICGASSKVVYRANWSSFDGSEQPLGITTERVMDSLDVADLVSEKEHNYRLSQALVGFATLRILPHPSFSNRDLWDGGRLIPAGVRESFTFRHLTPARPARLIFRTAPEPREDLLVHVGSRAFRIPRSDAETGWAQPSLSIPHDLVTETLNITVESPGAERNSYHLWLVQPLD